MNSNLENYQTKISQLEREDTGEFQSNLDNDAYGNLEKY